MLVKIITPLPYLEIKMECSYGRFHKTKNDLWEIGEEIDEDQEIRQGYVSEKCDYEGDLESIRVCNCEETKEYLKKIEEYYDICIPEGMDVVFTV